MGRLIQKNQSFERCKFQNIDPKLNFDPDEHNFTEEMLESLEHSEFSLGEDHQLFPQLVKYWDSYNPRKFLDTYPYLNYLLDNT